MSKAKADYTADIEDYNDKLLTALSDVFSRLEAVKDALEDDNIRLPGGKPIYDEIEDLLDLLSKAIR